MALHIKKSNPFLFYPFALVGVLLVSLVPPLFVLGWGYWDIINWLDTTSVSMVMILLKETRHACVLSKTVTAARLALLVR